MKRIRFLLALLHFSLLAYTSHAAVPLRWTVETSRLQPVVFDVVRGETLALEATFNSYGGPVSTSNQTAFLCWQTNGMANAWWTTNAVTSGNSASVLFTPSMDPGAPAVSAFIGLSSTNVSNISNSNIQTFPSLSYRAAFTLRFRHGPGAFPNVIEQPPRILDLAHTVVVNPPWPTEQDFAATTSVMRAELKDYVDGQITGAGLVSPETTTNIAGRVASNVVTKAYVEGLGIEAGLTEEEVRELVESSALTNQGAVAAAQAMTNDASIFRAEYNEYEQRTITDHIYVPEGVFWDIGATCYFYKPIYLYDVKSLYYNETELQTLLDNKANYSTTLSGYGISDAYTMEQTKTEATNAAEAVFSSKVPSDIGAASASDVQTLNSGYTRLYNFVSGSTNANFTATNYPPTAAAAAAKVHWEPEEGMDFTTVPASLQLNERRDGAWRTVMDTRDWTVWYYRFKERQLTNEIANLKAANAALSNRLETAKAWGNFTANGVENPLTDTTVVDRPNMWIMADYEWQKVVSGTNSCWVIRAKNAALSGGANTNGFLEICDAFGRPYMRVNKSAETFADVVFSNITYNASEGAWYVVFGNQAKPTKGGANCEIVGSSSGGGKCILYDEDLPECPATITWPETEDSHAGHWIMKAVPKPVDGVVPSVMFFGAEIKVAGKDYVEYIKEASFGAGIRVGNNVYEAVESGNTLIWQKKVE